MASVDGRSAASLRRRLRERAGCFGRCHRSANARGICRGAPRARNRRICRSALAGPDSRGRHRRAAQPVRRFWRDGEGRLVAGLHQPVPRRLARRVRPVPSLRGSTSGIGVGRFARAGNDGSLPGRAEVWRSRNRLAEDDPRNGRHARRVTAEQRTFSGRQLRTTDRQSQRRNRTRSVANRSVGRSLVRQFLSRPERRRGRTTRAGRRRAGSPEQ